MASLLDDVRTDPVICGDLAETLGAIREREVALALWTRPMPRALIEALARIDLDTVDDVELVLDLPVSAAALAASLVASGYEEVAAQLLAADILLLAACHALVAGRQRVTIRLEVVETDGCRRFHTDYVTYRLLTTYRGEATQWIRADAPDRVEQMHAGEVGLFKGRLLRDPPPVLHRSPPIEASGGEQRLLLVIDPVSE